MCCELVNGNGRYYTFKCQCNDWKGSEIIPTPPLLNVKNWALGDVVEVCCDISWKLALVLQALSGEGYGIFSGFEGPEARYQSKDLKAHME